MGPAVRGKSMKKKCLATYSCPLARGYNVIGDWWSLLIVTQVAFRGTRRFSEIQSELGLARNILTARLRKLVEQGVLQKVPASDGSAYHEYIPTERGRALYKVVIALRQWGETYWCAGEPASNALRDKQTQQPIPLMEVRAADGRVLGPDDLEVVPCQSDATDASE